GTVIGKSVDMRACILWWLIYVICVGISVNDQNGRGILFLIAGSLSSAFALFCVYAFQLTALTFAPLDAPLAKLKISGLSVDPRSLEYSPALAWTLAITISAITSIAIVICAYARPLIVYGWQEIVGDSSNKIK